MPGSMILFLLTGHVPPFLLVCFLIMCYLAGYELWKEQELQFLWKAWWVLFVFLLNILGLCDLLDLASDQADPRTSRLEPSA